MTRTGIKWITMVIVLALAAGVWAQRERGRDRKRSDRRPEGRSMADEQRDEHNRDRQRDEHRRGKPDVRIFRFEHIPAQSFMGVLEQLSRKDPLREILSHIPIALEEHSNAVVVIAPREAMELFEKIANELDAPSEFHKRMARRRGPGCPGNCRGSNRPSPGRGPGCPGNCGSSNSPTPGRCSGCRGNCKGSNSPSPGRGPLCPGNCRGSNRPSPGKEPGEINAEAIKKAIGNPVGQLFGKLLSSKELRLEKPQREAMHKVAQQCGQRVGQMHQRVIQAIRGMNREQRAANARKTVGHARAEMGKMAGEIRKHIFKILKPSQHKAATRILGAPGPGGAKGKPSPTAAPRGCGGSRNKGGPSPTAAPSGCGGCSGRNVVLGDTGNCKTSDF